MKPVTQARSKQSWGRVLLPSLIVLIWLVAAGFGGPLFGRISEVSSNDPTAYLPSAAESTKASHLAQGFYDSNDIPAVVLITAKEGALTSGDLESISAVATEIGALDQVVEVSPPIPAEDGAAVQIFAPVNGSADVSATVDAMRELLDAELPAGLSSYVTGPAGLTGDLVDAFGGIDGLLLAVALVAVLIILLFVYRSFLLPIMVITTSMFALTSALLTVWLLARSGVFLLNGQTQGILFILVIGAATDYSLLYVSRYREELIRHQDVWVATRAAWKSSVEPILAAGGTVIAGLMTLLLSDLKSNSVLGPVASIGIVFAMLAALTLLPSLLGLLGRKAFWPRRPLFDPKSATGERISFQGVWGRTVRFVERHARPVWIVTTLVLIIGAVGATAFKAEGVPQSDLVLSSSQARDGQAALGEHFPGGSGSPTTIVAAEDDLPLVAAQLLANDGVDSVTVASADSPSGQATLGPDGQLLAGPPGTTPPAPTVIDGNLLLRVTLTSPADSRAAIKTVEEIRADLDTVAPSALVGGTTATSIDTNASSIHDRNMIIPIVLFVILMILMLLLRSVLAPVLLMLTTILSFGTAMGVAAFVFNRVLKFPGADPAVPLYAFVFLVALGIDYNIFLMTRVREESKKHGTHEGVVRGLAVTGTVITSAGLVLAATFAALAVIPILFLVQLAFIVSFGVLLDTFVVRTLLVPALSLDIGKKIWWPSALSRQR